MKTTVVHCKKDKFDVYIGRNSKWGNPFVRGRDGKHVEVIAKYKTWFLGQVRLISELSELRGKTLGCYCAPWPCHGDFLARLADSTATDNGTATADIIKEEQAKALAAEQATKIVIPEVKVVQAPPVVAVPTPAAPAWTKDPQFLVRMSKMIEEFEAEQKESDETYYIAKTQPAQTTVAAKVKKLAAKKTEKV